MEDVKENKFSHNVELIKSIQKDSSAYPCDENQTAKDKKIFFWGGILGTPLAIIFLSIGIVMCIESFSGERVFEIKNSSLEKGLSIGTIVIGMALIIFTIICLLHYNVLDQLSTAEITCGATGYRSS